MSFLTRQIEQSLAIIEKYQGNTPFHLYLKDIFKQNKNWGSKDRKNYRAICYTYFRFFQLLKGKFKEEIVAFLYDRISNSPTEEVDTKAYYFLEGHLSNEISLQNINKDFSIEPEIYFRALPKYIDQIEKDFHKQGIDCEKNQTVDGVFRISAKINLETYLAQGKGYIQDLSCQLAILELSQNTALNRVWDCCSGAGGKSVDMVLLNPKIRLYCSDKRKQILFNLKNRFETLGLPIPSMQEIDLLNDMDKLNDGFLNQPMVVADVPCTGSGTWRRNPENVVYFKEESIKKYALIQNQILENLNPLIAPNGSIFYMTCSVFKEENEENIDKFLRKHAYEIVFQKYFGGYEHRADTIFGCLIRKRP